MKETKESDSIKLLNYDKLKADSEAYQKLRDTLFNWCLSNLPKGYIIEKLKKKKIIKYDWDKERLVEVKQLFPQETNR